jgi:hypothetical protein
VLSFEANSYAPDWAVAWSVAMREVASDITDRDELARTGQRRFD